MISLHRRERLLAIRCLQQFVPVHLEPRLEDVAVGLVVVDDEDALRIVHRNASVIPVGD